MLLSTSVKSLGVQRERVCHYFAIRKPSVKFLCRPFIYQGCVQPFQTGGALTYEYEHKGNELMLIYTLPFLFPLNIYSEYYSDFISL